MKWLLLFDLYPGYSIKMFRQYFEFVESNLKKQVESLQDEFDSLTDQENLEDDYILEIGKHKEEFININRSSLIMSIYGFAEKELVRLCVIHAERKDKTFSKNKDRKGAIKNAKEFLETIGMSFSELEKEWKLLDDVRLIRNCLAHDGGEVSEENNNLKEAIDRTEGVSISNELKEILLEKELTSHLTDAVEKVIKDIYKYSY